MRSALRRVAIGVLLGLLGGALALMIAIGRASLVSGGARGPGFIAPHHVTLAPSLLVGFVLGGGLLGLLAPLRRTPLGAFALGLIAAGGFMLTVFIGIAGAPLAWPRATWIAVSVSALLLGLVLGGNLQPE